jgi:hypothetical protein
MQTKTNSRNSEAEKTLRRKKMIKQTQIRPIAMNLGLILLIVLLPTFAYAIRLPNQSIPADGTWTISAPFTISDTGTLTFKVKLRVNTPFGVPLLGESQYEAALVKMSSPTAILVSQKRNVTATFETLTFTYSIIDCTKTGTYAIRLRNSGDINKQVGEAEFPDFFPPVLAPSAAGSLSKFGVTQGNTIPIAIPSALEPAGSGGRLRITATWDGICGLDTSGCKLRYQLLRNGAAFGTGVTGYAHNALFGNATPKMTLDISVNADQVSGDWGLQIKGDSRGDVSNVVTTIRFTPRCGG